MHFGNFLRCATVGIGRTAHVNATPDRSRINCVWTRRRNRWGGNAAECLVGIGKGMGPGGADFLDERARRGYLKSDSAVVVAVVNTNHSQPYLEIGRGDK